MMYILDKINECQYIYIKTIVLKIKLFYLIYDFVIRVTKYNLSMSLLKKI